MFILKTNIVLLIIKDLLKYIVWLPRFVVCSEVNKLFFKI